MKVDRVAILAKVKKRYGANRRRFVEPHACTHPDVPQRLPESVERYFDLVPGAVLVSVCQLKPSRQRPKGVMRAWGFMWEAYQGKRARRAPLDVTSVDGAYKINDGNSTYWVALASGWKSLPCNVRTK